MFKLKLKLELFKLKQKVLLSLYEKLKAHLFESNGLKQDIYIDILTTFAYEGGYYRLYMRDCNLDYSSVEYMIKSKRNDFTPVNEADLYYSYSNVLEYVIDKLDGYKHIDIIVNQEEEYFEIYFKIN